MIYFIRMVVMNLNSEYIEVKSSGEIFSKKGSNG